MLGTILHYDSLLSNTLKNPEFKSRKYRAVMSYADNTQLWERWEELFVNLFDELHEEHADAVLRGTQDRDAEGDTGCPVGGETVLLQTHEDEGI